jgi:starch synthase (maltosyl-transferring)
MAKTKKSEGKEPKAVAAAATGSDLPPSLRVVIESVRPHVNNGRFPAKAVENEVFTVYADIFRDGHDKACAWLLCRRQGEKDWNRTRMECINPGLDLWRGAFTVGKPGCYEYLVEAYCDIFTSWVLDTRKKLEAGQDVELDLQEGLEQAEQALTWIAAVDRKRLETLVASVRKEPAGRGRAEVLLSDEAIRLLSEYPDPRYRVVSPEVLPLRVDRRQARFASWYECFPRSCGTDPTKGGTFRDVENRLEDIKAMGFNVLYFPPIHPIGFTKRKGPNNSLECGPNDPGCPYSIGNHLGGHDALEPSLGNFDDFARLTEKCHSLGIEIAIDFAINCSPDHPYLKDHPDWFKHRPDGTIKYAENPPKKYEDIYPLDFDSPKRDEIWREMRRVLLFWAAKGVRIFRVDNPHTKPFSFWEWVIREVQNEYPDAVFLAEAFTRPRVMHYLAKAGFTQSYSYFTWRNTKTELIEYFHELTHPPASWYMRANLFTNTPDINPVFLQQGGRPAFKIRAVLAATLSPVYGIYSGFELCEGTPIPGREEYLNSEKYQFRTWDWNRLGNIKETISRLNRMRRDCPAFQENDNLRFLPAENDNILFYEKTLNGAIFLIVVNLDPFRRHHSFVEVPVHEYGIGWDASFQVYDFLTERTYTWKGPRNYVELDPAIEPAHVFQIRR